MRIYCRFAIFSVVLSGLQSLTDLNNCIQTTQINGLKLKVSCLSVGRLPDEIGVVISCCLWVWYWQFARLKAGWCWWRKVVRSSKCVAVVEWKAGFQVSVIRVVVGWLELCVMPIEADKVSWGASICSDSFNFVCCWMFLGGLVSVSAELLKKSRLS